MKIFHSRLLKSAFVFSLIICLTPFLAPAAVFSAEPWTRVFVGQSASVGVNPFTKATLCESVSELYEYDWHNGHGCKVAVPYGALAKIIAVATVNTGSDVIPMSTYVKLEGLEEPWAAWTNIYWITPIVPIGTSINLDRDFGPSPGVARLYIRLAPDGKNVTRDFGKSARATVIGQKGRLLRIRVTSGIAKGVEGTMAANFVFTDLAPNGLIFSP